MEILVLVLSILLSITVTLLFVYMYIIKKNDKKMLAQTIPIQPLNQTIVKPKDNTILNYKLQAYERIILLIERIFPPNLIIKIYDKSLKVREIQAIAIDNINKEYEHNITQQIYVNHKIWKLLTTLKDNHIMTINILADNYNIYSSGEYTKKIIESFDNEELKKPHNLLLEAINQEVKIILT